MKAYLLDTLYSKTIDVNDGLNYSIDGESGSFTAFQIPNRSGSNWVEEYVTVNVLGGQSSNPDIVRKNTEKNLLALTNMLRRIQYNQRGQYSWVEFRVVPPASNPARLYSGILIDWFPVEYLPDVTDYSNLPANQVNKITIRYLRRAPWLWSYQYENEWNGTDWLVAPTFVANGLSSTSPAQNLAWGGARFVQFTKTNSGAANLYFSSLGINAVAGQKVSIGFTTSFTGITAMDMQLIILPVAGRSNVATVPIHGYAIGDGYRFQLEFTPTVTGFLYPYFQISGPLGATVRFSEPKISVTMAPAGEGWSPSTADAQNVTLGGLAYGQPQTLTFYREEDTPSPTSFVASFPSYQPATGIVMITGNAPSGGVSVGSLPSPAALASGFSSVADAAGRALGGTVLRCTAAAATTYVQPLDYSSFGTRKVLVLAARNNAGANQWMVSVRVRPSVGATNYFELRPTRIIADTQCRIYVLGELSTPWTWGQMDLVVRSNVASGTIDFDWLAWVNVDESTNIMTYGGLPAAGTGINVLPYFERGYGLVNGGEVAPFDDALFMTKAQTLSMVHMCMNATTWSPPAGTVTYTLARTPASDHIS